MYCKVWWCDTGTLLLLLLLLIRNHLTNADKQCVAAHRAHRRGNTWLFPAAPRSRHFLSCLDVWIPSLSELLWLLLRGPTECWAGPGYAHTSASFQTTTEIRGSFCSLTYISPFSTKFLSVASEMLHRRHLRRRWWFPAVRVADGVIKAVYFFLFGDKGEYRETRRDKVLPRSKGAFGQMPLRCCGCDLKTPASQL